MISSKNVFTLNYKVAFLFPRFLSHLAILSPVCQAIGWHQDHSHCLSDIYLQLTEKYIDFQRCFLCYITKVVVALIHSEVIVASYVTFTLMLPQVVVAQQCVSVMTSVFIVQERWYMDIDGPKRCSLLTPEHEHLKIIRPLISNILIHIYLYCFRTCHVILFSFFLLFIGHNFEIVYFLDFLVLK